MTTVERVVLTRESRKKLKKIKYWSFGNVADSIECAMCWSIPEDTHEYADLKDALERAFAEFFSLENPSDVEIKSFQSNILSFHKGVYPDYSPDRRPRKKKSGTKRGKSPTSGKSGTKRGKSPRKSKNAED